jgi:hypothetical protein
VEHTYEQKRIPLRKIISLPDVFYAVAILISALPYIWVVSIFWLAIRAKDYLGYWPSPSHPDPKFLPFDMHQELLATMLFALLWSLALMPILYGASRWILKTKLGQRPLYTYILGWIIIVVMIFVPNINFVAWFLD